VLEKGHYNETTEKLKSTWLRVIETTLALLRCCLFFNRTKNSEQQIRRIQLKEENKGNWKKA